ncbi:class F sortase [Nocardioides sp. MH1]|uniref:class F sortase n=1 Tax=Nocardioides sp. MH1 TaxID=3242490 RepID=UPI003521F9C6
MVDQVHGNRLKGHLRTVAVLLLITAALTLVVAARQSATPSSAPPPAPGRSHHRTSPHAHSKPSDQPSFGAFLPGSRPIGLSIPGIDVEASSIVPLDLASDGTIEVPQDPLLPGWFRPGPTPGQLGPAVIAGHVDSSDGPAVFYRLGDLRPGDRIKVSRADGSVATFIVDRVKSYAKATFPTRKVYGGTSRAELRLITCGGTYDPDLGYLSNTVVFARLV